LKLKKNLLEFRQFKAKFENQNFAIEEFLEALSSFLKTVEIS